MLATLRPRWRLVWEGNVARALELLLAEEFDVVVADAQLLQLDNPVFFHAVAHHSPRTSRVAHSVVRSSPAHLRSARGAQRVMMQPLDAGEFLVMLDQALGERSRVSSSTARVC